MGKIHSIGFVILYIGIMKQHLIMHVGIQEDNSSAKMSCWEYFLSLCFGECTYPETEYMISTQAQNKYNARTTIDQKGDRHSVWKQLVEWNYLQVTPFGKLMSYQRTSYSETDYREELTQVSLSLVHANGVKRSNPNFKWVYWLWLMLLSCRFNPFSSRKIEKLDFWDSNNSTDFKHQ